MIVVVNTTDDKYAAIVSGIDCLVGRASICNPAPTIASGCNTANELECSMQLRLHSQSCCLWRDVMFRLWVSASSMPHSMVKMAGAYQPSEHSLARGILDTLSGQQQAVQPLPVTGDGHLPPIALLDEEPGVKAFAIVGYQHRDAALCPTTLLLDKLQEPTQHHSADRLYSSGSQCR